MKSTKLMKLELYLEVDTYGNANVGDVLSAFKNDYTSFRNIYNPAEEDEDMTILGQVRVFGATWTQIGED